MKKILMFVVACLLFFVEIASSQIYQPATPTQFGANSLRTSTWNTLSFPTGCGKPSVLTSPTDTSHAAIFFDSCNNIYYVFNPHIDTWDTVGGGGSFWPLTALSGTAGTGVLGTGDAQPFGLVVNNANMGQLHANGSFSIGDFNAALGKGNTGISGAGNQTTIGDWAANNKSTTLTVDDSLGETILSFSGTNPQKLMFQNVISRTPYLTSLAASPSMASSYDNILPETQGSVGKYLGITSQSYTTNTLGWISGSGWGLTGNAGTTNTNFLGTTDGQTLFFRVFNTPSGFVQPSVPRAGGNTALGFSTLTDSTCNQCTAIGSNTLSASNGGIGNTAIGGAALDINTTGNYNTAIGESSLYTNIVGSQNTALGFSSLNDETGSFNTSVGSQSLIQSTTDSYLTAVGYLTGTDGLAPYTHSIALGDSGIITGSNELFITHNITAGISAPGLTGTCAGCALIDATGSGLYTPQLPSAGSGWGIAGNALGGSGIFGSTDNSVVEIETNSTAMAYLYGDGQFNWGGITNQAGFFSDGLNSVTIGDGNANVNNTFYRVADNTRTAYSNAIYNGIGYSAPTSTFEVDDAFGNNYLSVNNTTGNFYIGDNSVVFNGVSIYCKQVNNSLGYNLNALGDYILMDGQTSNQPKVSWINSLTNTFSINTPSSFTSYGITVPSTQGAPNSYMQNDGTGILSNEIFFHASFSATEAAATTITVTLPQTMPNNTYAVFPSPTSLLAATPWYITNKTTTTFDIVYTTAVTGSLTFDYSISQ